VSEAKVTTYKQKQLTWCQTRYRHMAHKIKTSDNNKIYHIWNTIHVLWSAC